MNTSTLLLHALKGTCALNCLAALHLAGPRPVTQRAIMDLTGFDDKAVHKGLKTLLVLDLVICTGDEHRTAWQLAPEARRLRLALDPFLPSRQKGESQALKEEVLKEEIIETDIDIDFNFDFDDDLDSSSLIETPQPQNLETEPARLADGHEDAPRGAPYNPPKDFAAAAPDSPRGARAKGVGPPAGRDPRADKALRAQFYAAFEAANIYLQFRRPLADDLLAEDGPLWLQQTLGWLCYAQRQLSHMKRGALVYISLRDRLPCHPAYLPPPELAFADALAWAMRAGEAEPRDPDADDDYDGDDTNSSDGSDTNQTLRVGYAQTLRVLESPEAQLWRAVVERLALELPRAVIDAQLLPARLVALAPDRCRILVPTRQSRDWMALRLAPVLARALREITGRALAIDIEADG